MTLPLKGLVFGSFGTLLTLSVQVNAACYDTGLPAFANTPQLVELCFEDACEAALLSRSCGNIHYAAQDYDAGVTKWLFRVKYHEDGPEDDEYAILRNGSPVPSQDISHIRCASDPESRDCIFIDDILRDAQTK